jgi:hypothetical protein
MNFTDDEIMFLGALDGKKILNGLPSPLFNRGDRHFEEGYKYCGIAADRPASDYEEALRIAEAQRKVKMAYIEGILRNEKQ